MANKIKVEKTFRNKKAVKEFTKRTLKNNYIRRLDVFTEENARGDTRYRVVYYV